MQMIVQVYNRLSHGVEITSHHSNDATTAANASNVTDRNVYNNISRVEKNVTYHWLHYEIQHTGAVKLFLS